MLDPGLGARHLANALDTQQTDTTPNGQGGALSLAPDQIGQVWTDSKDTRARQEKGRDYYEGKQAILKKPGKRRDSKEYNKIVMNWAENIVNRHVGFLGHPFSFSLPAETSAEPEPAPTPEPEPVAGIVAVGPEPPGVEDATDDDAALVQYEDLRLACGLSALDSRMVGRALVAGYGVEVHSYDKDTGPQIDDFPAYEWAFVPDENGVDQIAIRRIELTEQTVYQGKFLEESMILWWVYNAKEIVIYEERAVSAKSASVEGMREVSRVPHQYGTLPVFRWSMTPDDSALLSDSFISLQDAYNEALSSQVDDQQSDIDALLKMRGFDPHLLDQLDPTTGLSTMERMKRDGVIVLQDKDSDASYIVKDLPSDKMQATLATLRDLIHVTGAAPDLEEIVGATGATSGIALRLQFQTMVEAATTFKQYIEIALRHRIDLLNGIWAKTGQATLDEYAVDVTFGIPSNEIEIWQNLVGLDPYLSHLDILRLIPSVEDPQAALEAKQAEDAETAAQGLAQQAQMGQMGQPGELGAPGGAGAGAGAGAFGGAEPGESVANLSATGKSPEDVIGATSEALAADLPGVLRDAAGVTLTNEQLAAIIEELLALLRAGGLT